MAERILMMRHGGALKPTDPVSEETLLRFPADKHVWATITYARRPENHRRFFALLNLIHEQVSDNFPTIDELRGALEVLAGHRITIYLPNGDKAFIPKSIAWSKMDEVEFMRMYDRIVDIVARDIIPGIDKVELKREVELICRLRKD